MSDLYYLEDTRQRIGNCLVWWRQGGCGYTTDVSKAGVFEGDRAFAQHNARKTDRPWPKNYVDGRARPRVDFQDVDHKAAMEGST